MTKDAQGNEIPGTPPEGQAPPVTPPPVPLENQVAEWKRKAEEARLEAEQARRDADMLREQQLRMMAQTSPAAATPPEPPENDDELNNLMTTNPVEAVRRIVGKEKKGIDQLIEQRARQIFLIEAKKVEAITRYPDLRNPNSEFFKKVAYYMDTHPGKYNDPEGILDACARVQVEIGIPPQQTPGAAQVNENVRQSVSSAAAQVAGSGNAPSTETPELDAKGLELAAKLGIDPKAMAARLKSMTEQSGEYALKPGKTGKASI